jgi:sterol desaturase/sphingolipid hydroxylase (fatty acid hydroxylase superfamily)
MDDLKYGKRDKRGDWKPSEHVELAPLFALPWKPLALLRWLPHYFLPWNLVFAVSAVAYWYFVVPDQETLRSLHWTWILRLYAVNAVAVFVFFSSFELRLYTWRKQENRFKYNGRFPGDFKNPAFLFNSQNLDGMIRTLCSAVPVWTAYEVGILYVYANGYLPWISFADHPWYLLCLWLLLPMFHEAHFFAIHRLIHWAPLYRWIHSVHHNSVNPSPWSSLSMHTVEHILYFSTGLLHLVVWSNPILAIYQLHFSGFGAVVGHIGFDKLEVGKGRTFDSGAYLHYLHHKYFEVNYGDGLLPLDKMFGTWHDGSPEGESRMEARYEKRKARTNVAINRTRKV